MAALITDVTTLKAAVLDYLDRPDLADRIDAFIVLAEAGFNQALRASEMEATAEVANADALPLPADFLEWISVGWTGVRGRAFPAFAEANSPEARYKHRPSGPPQYFTIVAQKVRVVPAQPGAIALTYYAAIPPLTAVNASNWLLAKAPDAYLYATLGQAYLFTKDPSAAQAHMTLSAQALGALTNKADTQKVAKRPARSAEIDASAQAAARPE